MNKPVTPITRLNGAGRRFAWAQPRVLVALMVLALCVSVWGILAMRDAGAAPTGVSAMAGAASSGAVSRMRSHSLADLPALVRAYGQRKQSRVQRASAAAVAQGASGASGAVSSIGTRNFSLTEGDLTPGNISDEREPAFRQSGDFIAFVSNGMDAINNVTGAAVSDGKLDPKATVPQYHVWIMNRNGTNQRQVTGLGVDSGRSQRHPSWSPDSNRLVYLDGAGNTSQLYFVSPFNLDPVTSKPPIQQVTFYAGEKRSPAWGPSGAIAFASNVVPTVNGTITPTPNNNFDIFSIDSSGNLVTLRRLTGGTADTLGNQTDDLNPAFSLVNVGVLFFSSNRAGGAKINGRRIWSMGAIDGSPKRQITDTTAQPGGYASDIDDNPAPSLSQNFPAANSNFTEHLAFQRSRRVDTSDLTRDDNIWTLPINSTELAPQPTPPLASLTVAGFNGNRIRDYNLVNGGLRRELTSQVVLNHPEDILYGPDLTGDGYPDLLVANRDRGAGTIELFNGVSGVYVRAVAVGGGANGLTNPTGMAIGPDGALYVASGSNDGQNSANAVFRIFLGPFNLTPTRFTNGGTVANGGVIANGSEGITFGRDVNNDFYPDLYVSALAENKVLVFNGGTGTFIREFVTAGSGGLAVPTGIAFGNDSNSDSVDDLYVCSADDTIKVFDGATGTFLVSLVTDFGLSNPERLTFGRDVNSDGFREIYVTSFGFGFNSQVNRYDGRTGASLPAAGKTGAIFINDPLLQGPSGLAFNPVATGVFRPTPPSTTPLETAANPATLESNLLSSPNGVTRARFVGATEDKSADVEPAFARSNSTSQLVSQIAFASQRRVPASPAANAALPINPGGGDQYVSSTPPLSPTKATHDIWLTSVQDFTPPILIPVQVGGGLSPALAPGPQAPFTAPRTFEEGLLPGSKVTVGFVVQDVESGLRTALVVLKDADKPTFTLRAANVNAGFPTTGTPSQVQIALEDQPAAVSTVVAGTARPLAMRVYDDGPVSTKGHERQQGAVAGDGTFYCEGSFATVDDGGAVLNGDYYIDLTVTDNAGNDFTYDNVYGFSTKKFTKSNDVLFVSDYTVGQEFSERILDFAPRSGLATLPIESYYLNNPGGLFQPDPNDARTPQDLITPSDVGVPDYAFSEDPADTTSLGSLQPDPVTGRGNYVDVWRILSRGPVPLDTMKLYSPQITEQLTPGVDATGKPIAVTDAAGNEVKRRVAVANSCMVWASPYTGDVFAAPGTLYDGATQSDITEFLKTGGRLFITGKEILFSLTNNGSATNAFLENELKAGFGGETFDFDFGGLGFRGATRLRFPHQPIPDVDDFQDAANNQAGMDIITPIAAGADETVTTRYSYDAGVAGQSIEKRNRLNGLESRVVFLAFGYEGIHREYLQRTGAPLFLPNRSENVRAKLFYSITRDYFYTGGISGKVISTATNQPIPNFLIEVIGGAQNYIARTDANGEYDVLGLAPGIYTVRPAEYVDANNVRRSANGSFFPGPTQGVNVTGGATSRGVDFRVQPAPPGSVSGRAISDKGTTDPADDGTPATEPAVNLPVLIRSVKPLLPSASFPQGGIYAAITVTDNAGNFAFRNVPSNEGYELIFNPLPGFMNATNAAERGDLPPGSGIVFPNPNPASPPQVNLNFERRIIPVDPAYGLDFTNPAILDVVLADGSLKKGFLVPIGQDLNIGDVPVPPGDGPNPGTGGGGSTDDFLIGSVYMISIPWMDSSALAATTTPEKAFTLPPTDTRNTPATTDDIVNYRLTKFDPLTQKYVTLVNGALLTRGEGYFIRPVNQPVSFKRPPTASPARVPLSTGVREFTITLRRSASLSPTDPNNGFNLIGFPFNPDVVKSVNWNVSRVFVPSTGSSYPSLTSAVAAGVLSANLQTLTDTTGTAYTNTTKMVAFKGYFAKTYIDNVQVTIIGSTTP